MNKPLNINCRAEFGHIFAFRVTCIHGQIGNALGLRRDALDAARRCSWNLRHALTTMLSVFFMTGN